MEASMIDLRYIVKAVCEALRRNETVYVTFRGDVIAKILPCISNKKHKQAIEEHPFFGMLKTERQTVESQMDQLRSFQLTENSI